MEVLLPELLAGKVVIMFLSCNMIEGLIEFIEHLGLKEEEHFVASAGKFIPVFGAAGFDARLRTDLKRLSLNHVGIRIKCKF
jgi:hypothetical protein